MRRYPFFQIFYSTTFTILFIALVCLLLISPGDIIRQALNTGRVYDICSVAGTYLLTILFVVIIYASRLYANRAVLAAIPKEWAPVDDAEVGKEVAGMIRAWWHRSEALAWVARPKDVRAEGDAYGVTSDETAGTVAGGIRKLLGRARQRKSRKRKAWSVLTKEEERRIASWTGKPGKTGGSWDHIAHPGWSAPSMSDFPSLHYATVIAELPHLIEAKAVSLAPGHSMLNHPRQDMVHLRPPSVDPRILELLQRPAAMGMRHYLRRLVSFGVIVTAGKVVIEFIARYEYARFSDRVVTVLEFRGLMTLFAKILQSMTDLDMHVFADHLQADEVEEDVRVSTGSNDVSRSAASPWRRRSWQRYPSSQDPPAAAAVTNQPLDFFIQPLTSSLSISIASHLSSASLTQGRATDEPRHSMEDTPSQSTSGSVLYAGSSPSAVRSSEESGDDESVIRRSPFPNLG